MRPQRGRWVTLKGGAPVSILPYGIHRCRFVRRTCAGSAKRCRMKAWGNQRSRHFKGPNPRLWRNDAMVSGNTFRCCIICVAKAVSSQRDLRAAYVGWSATSARRIRTGNDAYSGPPGSGLVECVLQLVLAGWI